jgi:hypothetical protein
MSLCYEAFLFIPTDVSLCIHMLGSDKNSSYFYFVLYVGKLFNNQNDLKR